MSSTIRAGADSAWNPDCGACAILKMPTCVVVVTPASSSGASPPRNESTPVAALDCAMNVTISRRSSPSRAAAACGKRSNAIRPATPTEAVEISCAMSTPAIASTRPYCAPIATPTRRSAIDHVRKPARMS